jgi:hypothetical protein
MEFFRCSVFSHWCLVDCSLSTKIADSGKRMELAPAAMKEFL